MKIKAKSYNEMLKERKRVRDLKLKVIKQKIRKMVSW